MSTVSQSFGVDKAGNKFAVDIRDGVSYIAGTMQRPEIGSTIQTAGGIFFMGEGYQGVRVANHNMVPVEDKQNPVLTPVEQKAQQNTVITPTPGTSTNYPVYIPTAPTTSQVSPTSPEPLPDIIYVPNGTGGYDTQQNTVASLGIDNSTLVLGGLLLGGIVLLKKFMG